MFNILIIFTAVSYAISGVYFNEYEDITQRNYHTYEDNEFAPIITLSKDAEKLVASNNINCDDFTVYALNCTTQAAAIYNSTKKQPPMPNKLGEWCSAVRHLISCATDWNTDCKDVAENHFYEESINGHIHVLRNICDDEWFLSKYQNLSECIETTAAAWEECYTNFKRIVDDKKNTTHEWTHYVTHFYLCCARAQFRRCTLETLLNGPNKCTQVQAVILQKFSVIVSEGDVFQDCDFNIIYSNCPDGDPRPNEIILSKLVLGKEAKDVGSKLSAEWCLVPVYLGIHLINVL